MTNKPISKKLFLTKANRFNIPLKVTAAEEGINESKLVEDIVINHFLSTEERIKTIENLALDRYDSGELLLKRLTIEVCGLFEREPQLVNDTVLPFLSALVAITFKFYAGIPVDDTLASAYHLVSSSVNLQNLGFQYKDGWWLDSQNKPVNVVCGELDYSLDFYLRALVLSFIDMWDYRIFDGRTIIKNFGPFWSLLRVSVERSHWADDNDVLYELFKSLKEIKFSNKGNNQQVHQMLNLNRLISLDRGSKIIAATDNVVIVRELVGKQDDFFRYAKRITHSVTMQPTNQPWLFLSNSDSFDGNILDLVNEQYPDQNEFLQKNETPSLVPILADGTYQDLRVKWKKN